MTIPASVSACLFLKVSSLIFALTFKRVENMEIRYIEAGVLERMLARAENLSAHAGVLERMLARAENLSAHVDRLYERNRCKEPGE